MQFGVNTWVWTAPLGDDNLLTLAPRVAEAGFDMIELPIEVPNGFDYRRAAAIIREHGLAASAVVVMSPDRDLIHPEESTRAHAAAYIRHCVDAAQTLGAAHLGGPMYSAVGRVWQMSAEERERDTATLVRQLRDLAEYAGDRGVVLCVEPLNRFETSFLNLTAQAVEVIDRVGHPACRILLDTFHMNIEERSLGDAIRLAGHRLRHVHACENDRGAPGTGHVPWQDVAAALREIGYDGPVVIESFTDKVQSIARAAAIWRPLASSQDALATEGLAFLRQILA